MRVRTDQPVRIRNLIVRPPNVEVGKPTFESFGQVRHALEGFSLENLPHDLGDQAAFGFDVLFDHFVHSRVREVLIVQITYERLGSYVVETVTDPETETETETENRVCYRFRYCVRYQLRYRYVWPDRRVDSPTDDRIGE